jgi:6,7-dimethyl-8-ribityllumazine synthase
MSKKNKFLIVASNFYPKITDGLLNGAISELKKHKCKYDIFKVNGSLEIPVQISILIKKKKYDAVIAVGCIIKGKTDHYEFIANAITNSLLSISVDKNIPISNTVLTCTSLKQAIDRSTKKSNRAKEAVLAAISVLKN